MLDTLMAIAADAAKLVMTIYEQPFQVDYKGPSDPVTQADRLANQLICERLNQAFPDIPIVAEESVPEHWANYRASERIFFVDPVDGTREFVAKNGQFIVMIGLVEGDRPTRAVMHAPALNQVWAGEVGVGAFHRDAQGLTKKLSPLHDRALKEATLIASKSKSGRLSSSEVKRLNPARLTSIGSAGLKGAAVADGSADVYYAKKKAGCLWDTCAPEAILRALGGEFTDAQGQLIDYRAADIEQNNGAVAAAPRLHREVITVLRGEMTL